MKRIKIEKKLKKELDHTRFTHTLGVMYTAAALAMAYGMDVEQAIYAGLLHDCAKCIPNEDKLTMCQKNHILIEPWEKREPFLLHAKLGAYLAQHKYKIKEPEILHAISVHTTGEPEMNDLDKIIFIADYIEPNRTQAPNLPEIRALAFVSLNQTMEQILSDTLQYLKEKGGELDPKTAETFEWFRQYNKNKNLKEAT
ncbi:MAG: bis(5'-nucleosyl)-tetraphosphatase (symmetrical) YqeK [Lachnospiraceae bacterium]